MGVEVKKPVKTIKFIDGGHFFRKFILEEGQDDFQLVELPENDNSIPDLLICSCFNKRHLNYNCKKLLILGENLFPNMNEYDYAISTYKMDFGNRHFRMPYYSMISNWKRLSYSEYKENDYNDELFNRKFCCALIGETYFADPRRLEYLKLIDSFKHIDSAGKVMHNVDFFVPRDENAVDDYYDYNKIKFFSNYKFSIAFENCITEGYVTEKILESIDAKTVPIYFGTSLAKREFNKNCYINALDFKDKNELVEYIKYLDNNKEAYMKKLKVSPKFIADTDYIKGFKEFFKNVLIGKTYNKRYGALRNGWR